MSNTAVDYASQCTQCKAVTSGKLVYRKYILGKLKKNLRGLYNQLRRPIFSFNLVYLYFPSVLIISHVESL